MPDVWTKHPVIVRDLLKEGGFKCGVAPRVLKDRDPAWTCIIDGKQLRGDIYIHHVDTLRSELGLPDIHAAAGVGLGAGDDWILPGAVLLLAVAVARWLSLIGPKGQRSKG